MESSLSHRDDYEIAAAAAENGQERFSFVSFLVAFVSLSQELGTQRSDSENIKVSYTFLLKGARQTTHKEAGFMATRGIVRDRGKDWILGYNKYLGNCSIFYAKS
ncbi:hypothetical protein Gohar_007003 [Gossypium harknessii]|uniref:Uncharacterized protein n=1 Tax=Gossypium harknessii TaxID=34285 RepID=A0A7J9GF64_9ROSI|nr:hypothetical protein [Gossypium harknessii]